MDNVSKFNYNSRRRKMMTRKFQRKKWDDKKIDNYFEVMTNPVALSEKDITDRINAGAFTTTLEEVILANWQIEAWYVADRYRAEKFFSNAINKGLIVKPVYLIGLNNDSKRVFDVTDPAQSKEFLMLLKDKRF